MSLDSLSPSQKGWVAAAASGSAGLFDLIFLANKNRQQLQALQLIPGQSRLNPLLCVAGSRFAVPSQAVVGAVEAWVDRRVDLILAPKGNPSHEQKIFSSFVGGAIAAPLVCPIEAILTQVQMRVFQGEDPRNVNVWKVIRSMYQQNGMNAFTRGTLATSLRDMPYTYGYLKGHEILQPHVERLIKNPTYAQMASAYLAGAICAIVSQPFDVIKTAMQGDLKQEKYTTFRNTTLTIYRDLGWMGFFEGLSARIGRVSFAIFYMNLFMYYGTKAIESR